MSFPHIGWKVGLEVELLAPAGSSRRVLAQHLAQSLGGQVQVFFHPQSELSLVPGSPVFDNLTPGFKVMDARGDWVASCVDDITLQRDLDRERSPLPGWFRVVSDDLRLLHLVARVGRADAGPLEALTEVATLFGTAPECLPEGMVRVCDEMRAPIAIATPLPGERERPCELITPPLSADHGRQLETLLKPARELGFTLAHESATHVHFDGAPLRSARVLRNLVRLLEAWGPTLKALVGVNPACCRLGPWPSALRDLVDAPGFTDLDWVAAQTELQALGLSKYCDFNLKNLVHDVPGKPTFEVRVLPGLADTATILAGVALFEAVLHLAVDSPELGLDITPPNAAWMVRHLPLAPDLLQYWLGLAQAADVAAHGPVPVPASTKVV